MQRIQESFSPVTSPVSSPKALRRRFKSPNRGPAPARAALPPSSRQRGPNSRRNHKDEYREVQSEPEFDNCNGASTGSRRLLDKRKSKTRPKILDISNPIPIESRKRDFGPDTNGLYCSANDIAIYGRDTGFVTKSVDHYGTVKNHREPIYGIKKAEKLRNGFHYVNSVPNIIDPCMYEPARVKGPRTRNEIERRKELACNGQSKRNNSRIEEYQKNSKENIYWSPGFAPLQGSKSLGRLDGIKEVSF